MYICIEMLESVIEDTGPKMTDLGKGKVHPCTGTKALYRPHGLQGEQRYSSTLSWPRYWKGVSGQQHAPAVLYPRERPGTHCIGGWMGPRAVLDRCRKFRPPPPGFDSRTVQSVASLYTAWATRPTTDLGGQFEFSGSTCRYNEHLEVVELLAVFLWKC